MNLGPDFNTKIQAIFFDEKIDSWLSLQEEPQDRKVGIPELKQASEQPGRQAKEMTPKRKGEI